MIVNMGFPCVLLGLILVGLMGMNDRRVVVLVFVLGSQMGPLLALRQVVGHVGVLMLMDLGLVAVLFRRKVRRGGRARAGRSGTSTDRG